MSRILLIVVCFTLILPGCTRNEKSNLNRQVDVLFAKWNSEDSPGCSVAAARKGALVHTGAYGMANLDHDIAITPNTLFHVASVSKQFTAAAIVLLAQEGKLALDDDVRTYITELPDFGHKITIRNLIHHTSGLRDQWDLLSMTGWRYSRDLITDEDVMSIVKLQKGLNFEPGSQHLYSNTGYTLLAQIIKRVSGQSLREFTSERIFKPLGMNSTFFRDDFREVVKNQAYGYIPKVDAEGAFQLSVTNFDTVGATSLLTTPSDLMKWARNFEVPLVGGEALAEQMQVRGQLANGKSLSYAFAQVHGEYRGQPILSHGGSDAGYRSALLRFPALQFNVAVLCNTPIDTGMLARRIADVLISEDLDSIDDSNPDSDVAMAYKPKTEVLNEHAGLFWNETSGTALGFTVNDEHLSLDYQRAHYELTAITDARYRMEPTGMIVEFNADSTQVTTNVGQDAEADLVRVDRFDPDDEMTLAYAGTYRSDELEVLYRLYINSDGQLTLRFLKSNPFVLEPHMRDVFVGDFGTLSFRRDENGEVSGFGITSGRIRNLPFSRM